MINDLIRNTIRYTSVTSVTLLMINNLHRVATLALAHITRQNEIVDRSWKIGNIGYTPQYQELNWQQNWQPLGNSATFSTLQTFRIMKLHKRFY